MSPNEGSPAGMEEAKAAELCKASEASLPPFLVFGTAQDAPPTSSARRGATKCGRVALFQLVLNRNGNVVPVFCAPLHASGGRERNTPSSGDDEFVDAQEEILDSATATATSTARDRDGDGETPKEQDGLAGQRDSVDVTYSQLASTEGHAESPPIITPRKRGRPRKLAVPTKPTEDAAAQDGQDEACRQSNGQSVSSGVQAVVPKKRGRPRKVPIAQITPEPEPQESPSRTRTSSRPHKAPLQYEPSSEPEPRRIANITPASATKTRTPTKPKVVRAASTPDVESESDEDDRQRRAGVARVYIDPAGSARNKTSGKSKVLGRPRKSMIAVFKSKKLENPNHLEENMGNWLDRWTEIEAEKIMEKEKEHERKAEERRQKAREKFRAKTAVSTVENAVLHPEDVSQAEGVDLELPSTGKCSTIALPPIAKPFTQALEESSPITLAPPLEITDVAQHTQASLTSSPLSPRYINPDLPPPVSIPSTSSNNFTQLVTAIESAERSPNTSALNPSLEHGHLDKQSTPRATENSGSASTPMASPIVPKPSIPSWFTAQKSAATYVSPFGKSLPESTASEAQQRTTGYVSPFSKPPFPSDALGIQKPASSYVSPFSKPSPFINAFGSQEPIVDYVSPFSKPHAASNGHVVQASAVSPAAESLKAINSSVIISREKDTEPSTKSETSKLQSNIESATINPSLSPTSMVVQRPPSQLEGDSRRDSSRTPSRRDSITSINPESSKTALHQRDSTASNDLKTEFVCYLCKKEYTTRYGLNHHLTNSQSECKMKHCASIGPQSSYTRPDSSDTVIASASPALVAERPPVTTQLSESQVPTSPKPTMTVQPLSMSLIDKVKNLGKVSPPAYKSSYASPYAVTALPRATTTPYSSTPMPNTPKKSDSTRNTAENGLSCRRPSHPGEASSAAQAPTIFQSPFPGPSARPYQSIYPSAFESPRPYKSVYSSTDSALKTPGKSAADSQLQTPARPSYTQLPDSNSSRPPWHSIGISSPGTAPGGSSQSADLGQIQNPSSIPGPQMEKNAKPQARESSNNGSQASTTGQTPQQQFAVTMGWTSDQSQGSMNAGLPDFVRVSAGSPMSGVVEQSFDDFYGYLHQKNVRSLTPQTPQTPHSPAPRVVNQPMSTTKDLPRSASRNKNDRSGSISLDRESTPVVPTTPQKTKKQIEEETEAALTTATAVEIPNTAARISAVFNGLVGNLVLSADKLTLTFIGVTQTTESPPHLVLKVENLVSNPVIAQAGKIVDFSIKAKTLTGPKVYKFRMSNKETSLEFANVFKKDLLKAKVAATLQQKLSADIATIPKNSDNPSIVDKPFTCSTCDGKWLNKEGLSYHVRFSRTRCNPNWVPVVKEDKPKSGRKRKAQTEIVPEDEEELSLWTPAPSYLPHPDTGAWDQIVIHGSVNRRTPRRRQKKVFEEHVPILDETPGDLIWVWDHALAYLPNAKTGAWDQTPAPPSKAPRRSIKKAKAVKPLPVPVEVKEDSLEPTISESSDAEIDNWVVENDASRKRRRKQDSDFESEDDAFVLDGAEDEDDGFIDNDVDASDSDAFGDSIDVIAGPRKPSVGAKPSRRSRRKLVSRNSRGAITKDDNALFTPGSRKKAKSVWRNPNVKNPMTEEEKAAKRARAILRQQTWPTAPTFMPNPETGAWDQPAQARVKVPYKPFIRGEHRLPEPVTYMQAPDGSWSIRPFGHGVRPIFARPSRRAQGNPNLDKYLEKIESSFRPVIMPKKRMLGPAPLSRHLLRDLARPSETPEGDDEEQASNNIPKRRYQKRPRVLDSDDDDEFGPRISKRTKRPVRGYRRGSTADYDVEEGNILQSVENTEFRRVTRGLKAQISSTKQEQKEDPTSKKLDAYTGRQVNPGLGSLPDAYGLPSFISHSQLHVSHVPSRKPSFDFLAPNTQLDDDVSSIGSGSAVSRPGEMVFPESMPPDERYEVRFSEPLVIKGNQGTWATFLAEEEGESFTLQGWWPTTKWFLDDTFTSDFSLEDILHTIPDKLGPTESYPSPEWVHFLYQIESVAEWEQGAGKYLLCSGTLAPEYRWIAHGMKSLDRPGEAEPNEIQWLDENAYTVETIPYASLQASEGSPLGGEPETKERPKKRPRISAPKRPSGRPARIDGKYDTQKRYKNRTQTALPADLKGLYESIEDAASKFGVQVATTEEGPSRRQRTNTQEGAMSSEQESRLLVATVVQRTVTGGLDQTIDWVLVGRQFPDFSMNHLKRKWEELSKHQKALVEKVGRGFQEPFLIAYENGDIPPIDYDNLPAYDWKSLTDWTIKNVDFTVEIQTKDLPSSREKLNHKYDMIPENPADKDWRDAYFHLSTAGYKRLEIMSHHQNTVGLHPQQNVREVDDFAVVKSWARASTFTPDQDWVNGHDKIAERKLRSLDKSFVKEVIEDLISSKVIAHKSKQKRPLPGRHFEVGSTFIDSLRKHMKENQFVEAANFKAYLDGQFLNPDGEGRRSGVPLDWMADEGTIMCITNLQAHGRIELRSPNIPTNKWGFTNGGYETRRMDKKNLRFNMSIFPTPTYIFTEQIPEIHSLAHIAPPSQGPSGAIPVWCDIAELLMESLWRRILVAVIGILSLRSGTTLQELKREFAPALEDWDLALLLQWAETVGIVLPCAADTILVGPAVEGLEGWRAGEWWWLLVGAVCRQ
ncbi:hypothetical protein BP6252_00472 [Coleophoma cylindrospora]|uniref:Transcription factor tau subunit sfc3/Tfc3 C-terminal domain-containing protein n=1 Tax=Coleophoma cylindrospora TaxID=1849047 RepID=A0A3D8SQ41_9HELO|nr:hypothetical protein BP6252_00472 [Coleophoma cylindrospora]